MKNAEELLEKFSKEMEMDSILNALNMSEKQYDLPKLKYKWLNRKIECSKNLLELKKAKDKLVALKIKNSPLGLSKPKAKNVLEDEEDVQRLTEEINSYELLVDYITIFFEDVVCGMSYDIKNLIALIQAEQN